MIRQSLNLLGVSAVLFSTGGCTSTGGITTPSVASVQQALVYACGYELLASTAAADIAAVASTLVPGASGVVVTASMVAAAICAAVKPAPTPAGASASRPGFPVVHGGFVAAGEPVKVNGVLVHGAFVK